MSAHTRRRCEATRTGHVRIFGRGDRKMTSTHRQKARQTVRRGVSLAALAAMGIALPAWAAVSDEAAAASQAQTPPQSDSGDSAQSDQSAPRDDIVVTGRRAALEAADERKRRSETIIDSVVADDAGKLPDNSITEVLQRVSGVTIVRFAALNDPDHYSVEGTGIQVRGLTGVASRLNGREIFSANNGRSLQFADVTPELMAAVDVYKASTADLIEGGTGGQIDLRTKVPFDYRDEGFHVAATGDLSMGDLARKADPSGSILVSKRWSTPIGDIGFLGDLAYSRLSSNSHFFRVEPYFRQRISGADYYIPGGYTYGEEQFQRTRTGIYGAVQWAPSDALTFTGTFFQSRYKNRSGDWGAFVSSQTLAVDPATSEFDENNMLVSTPLLFNRDQSTFLPAGLITTGGNKGAYASKTTTKDYSLSFDWSPTDSPLSIKGAIQRVDSSQISDRMDVFRDVQFPAGFGFDLSGDLPVVTMPAGSQARFDNPASYFWAASMPHQEDNSGRLDSANLDLEYKFEDSFFKSIKVGGRAAKRTERDFNNGYNWAALGRGWNGDPQLTYANAAPGDVELHVFKNFFHGQAALPANLMFPTDALVRRFDRAELTASPPAGFCGSPPTDTAPNPLWNDCSAAGPLPQTGYGGFAGIRPIGFVLPIDRVDNETKTYAGYALVRFGSDAIRLSGNVGARVVHIRNEGSGFVQQNAATFIRNGQTQTLLNVAVPRGGKASFTRVLPSINFDYALADNAKIRFGYNITLDLPTFQALRASGSIGAATIGNPGGSNLPNIFTNFTADTGNPLLKPALSNNFDLSFEYYPSAGTSFHLAPFYKRLTNLPIYSLTQRDVTFIFADGTTENASVAATDYSNSSKAATVKGVEVGGRIFFDMLPGLLSGLGFEGNYTYVDSKNPGDTYRDINGVTHSDAPLVGLSKHNFNAVLLYERKAVSARIAYSWRSRYLQTTNSNGTNPTYQYYSAPGVSTPTQIALPIYGANYGQLEAGVRFRVTENFSFNVQGTNLTNSMQRTLMGGYPGGALKGRSWFQADRRISTGISLAF
ncbi:TonB-dependent receptor [Sphingomonas cannabina]|uniref:TonB-dependent receptor n=1 Tax=Sphingomonas cannabina TaxID=2899123 RepID=UPI001F1A575C|nr:TonB-dependent receptor [Sphingomonas cannabina]UIJ47298.1 TonB-dependent receptor [Sphingomonas cannabina]